MEEKELRALVSLLSDEDEEVLSHVEQKIISLGDPVIPYLESEWESNFNPYVQKRIEDLIHHLQYSVLEKKLRAWKEGGAEDLLEGLWLIATYQYPDLEYSKLRKEMEQIYYETWLEMKNDIHPFDQIRILNDVLFGKLKFSANTKNFHAPNNSMLNIVLESHKGNPISLCAVYMLVAQRLKLPVYGVNLPNLFVLTYKSRELQFYINAFNRGLIFYKSDIDNYISHLNLAKMDLFYEPCSNLDIIRRMLRNLIISFEKLGEKEKMEEIKRLVDVITDESDVNY
ncbi:transglutaminase-like domain-containing protein [Catalinimonas alkaloidigena]|nr:transglutaminase-like domain-containing protein [Catalinimonas alkaloidigena]